MKKILLAATFMASSFLYGQQNINQIKPNKLNTKPIITKLDDKALEYLFSDEDERDSFTKIVNSPHYEKNFPLTAHINKSTLESFLLNLPSNDISLLSWLSHSALEEENYSSKFLGKNKNFITVIKLDTNKNALEQLTANINYKINSEDIDTTKYYITATLLYENADINLDTNTAVFRGDIVIPGNSITGDWTATSIALLKYFQKEDVMYYSIKSYTRKNNIFSTIGGWFNLGCDREHIADTTLAIIQSDVDRAVAYLKSKKIIEDSYESLKNGKISTKNHQKLFEIICNEMGFNSSNKFKEEKTYEQNNIEK